MVTPVAMSGFITTLVDMDGLFEADRLTNAFQVSKDELATTTGIPRASLYRSQRVRGPVAQKRLRETAEIMNRILPWCGGSVVAAYAWFRSQPLPAFGDATPAFLVRQGRAQHVMSYLDGLSAGGYA